MSNLKTLRRLEGTWVGESRLIVEPPKVRSVSESRLVVSPVALGKFLRVDYTWADGDRPQDGSMLLGRDGEGVKAWWVDSWHMGEKVMECVGRVEESGAVDVLGSYSAPPGPDWGWRIVISGDEGKLVMRMFNISPEKEEALAVEGTYRRG